MRDRARRQFLGKLGAAAAALGGVVAAQPNAGSAQRKPNIILVLVDDLGWAELGCYGNTFNETPTLDSLARQGMRFTDAYAAAPVCSPTRAAFLAGQWPARLGITDYLRPNDPKHLSTELTTIAKVLRNAGYATGIIGKWHLSGYANDKAPVETPPSQHGFDEVIVSENRGIGGGSYFHPYHFNREVERRLPEPEHLIDRMNLEAVEFIERHREQPFFLYLSHYAVHTRLNGRPDLVAKYRQKLGAGTGPDEDRGAPRNNPHLAAQLECIDRGVGMILAKLKELGLLEHTVVIFTGDNGGEDRVTSNAPFRAGKSTLYEGGIREPLIISCPGAISPGTVCSAPVCTVDFYPTFCELTGAMPPAGQRLDGTSLVPLLTDPQRALPRDTLYWHYPLPRPHFLGGRSAGAIRQGDWKLIEFFDTGEAELYDLSRDIGEARNLADAMPEKVAELRKALADWRRIGTA